MTTLADKLTNRKLLFKNISFNFIVSILTMIIGVLTVPHIIKGLGLERFGILSIVWVIIGYSSLFDFNLGRALTRMVSQELANDHQSDIPSLVWTAVITVTLVSCLVGVGVGFAAPTIVSFIKVRAVFVPETVQSVQLLAVSLPTLIGLAALRGVMESYQKFIQISILRLPVLFCNYILPLIILIYAPTLSAIVAGLVIGRIVVFIAHFWVVARLVPHFFQSFEFRSSHLKPLLSFGGWCTVSNVLMPLMTYLDRLSITFLLSSATIAYYSTPYDVLNRIGIIPAAVMSVMFPAMTSEFHKKNFNGAKDLYNKSLLSILGMLIVPLTILAVFAKPLLSWWISPDFAQHSALLAQLICIEFIIGALNNVPFTTIQARGRSDLTAFIHGIEFFVYFPVLYFTITHFGLIGAPIAALVRATLDSIMLHFIAIRYFNGKTGVDIPVDNGPLIMDDIIPTQPAVG